MSLIKTYAVGCEGVALVDRLRQLNRLNGILPSYRDHVTFGGHATSSKRARQLVIRDGWTRATVTLPLSNNRPDGDATQIKFDLCPSCSEMLKGAI